MDNKCESTLMYKTLLKLLSHDTRNTFVKLKVLMDDIEDGPVKNMIIDAVEELYETIASSSGFLDGKKRIQSIHDMLVDLKITSDKISLENHKRVDFCSDPKVFLFGEVSELFNHALLNIIENALKYSEDEDKIEVSIKRKASDIVIEVTDSGIGMVQEDIDSIFEQGYRAKIVKDIEGTGTGLWITKNIINRDGGTITVKSELGFGSTFIVTIPAFHTPSLEKAMDIIVENFIDDPDEIEKSLNSVKTLVDLHNPPPDVDYDSVVFANLLNYLRKERRKKSHTHFKDKLLDLKTKNPNGKKVLIVDDSSYVHYYLGNYFTDLGYNVVDFGFNGEEGYKLYSEYRPDIVTLDITMPVMSGLEASEKILEIDSNANLLFLSGLGSHKGLIDNIHSKLGSKPYSVLTKPFTVEKLKEVLKDFN